MRLAGKEGRTHGRKHTEIRRKVKRVGDMGQKEEKYSGTSGNQ